jgi:hypothetical protein
MGPTCGPGFSKYIYLSKQEQLTLYNLKFRKPKSKLILDSSFKITIDFKSHNNFRE